MSDSIKKDKGPLLTAIGVFIMILEASGMMVGT